MFQFLLLAWLVQVSRPDLSASSAQPSAEATRVDGFYLLQSLYDGGGDGGAAQEKRVRRGWCASFSSGGGEIDFTKSTGLL